MQLQDTNVAYFRISMLSIEFASDKLRQDLGHNKGC
jgi:hypothetical protein